MNMISRIFAAIALLLPLATVRPAFASGPTSGGPWDLDAFGGGAADRASFYDGHVGVILPSAARSELYATWRLLHGQAVGVAIGETLSIPCCGDPDQTASDRIEAWRQARKAVPDAAEVAWIQTDRPGPDNSDTPNCFGDAFATAASTLRARIASHGASSPWVKVWLNGQEAVFQACSEPAQALPALAPDAPVWLKKDQAYQWAALKFYSGDYASAAADFAAIGADPASPWRIWSAYLVARSRYRAALAGPTPQAYALARQTIEALKRSPPGTPGREEAIGLLKALAIREDPAGMRKQLASALAAPDLAPTAASDFRDLVELGAAPAAETPVLDWIATIKADGAVFAPELHKPLADPVEEDWRARERKIAARSIAEKAAARTAALAHAWMRWQATHDAAWLLAVLSLSDPDETGARELVAAAAALPPSSPAYLTGTYQRIRLTIATATPAATRSELDAILRRRDLSVTTRNLFLAERAQVAETLARFAVLSLRRRVCGVEQERCVRADYNNQEEPWGVYDGKGYAGSIGIGENARLIIDRMPLSMRMALAEDRSLPPPLRLDIALTSWVRATLLQDDTAVNAMTRRLKPLLPQLSDNWDGVLAARTLADRRVAEAFVLAKLPGARTDLADYVRPEGTVGQFQGAWPDWRILPPGHADPAAMPPPPEAYYPQALQTLSLPWPILPADAELGRQTSAMADPICFGLCNAGAFPVRLPAFVAKQAARARTERGYFPRQPAGGEMEGDTFLFGENLRGTASPPEPGSLSLWDLLFDYAATHPKDPRAPEMLHRLIHVVRFGQKHDHLGRRAFLLLHARYPASAWTKRAKYYYD
jgi:TolA-binding protein